MKTKTLLLTIVLTVFAMYTMAQTKKPPVKKTTTTKTPVKKTTTTKTPVKKTTVKEVEMPGKGTFKDIRDGKIYKTIKIGTQTWMAENLAYNTIDGCWAYNSDPKNVAKYGYLYDWKTAKNAAPKGWHLPTDAEWTTLVNFLGGMYQAGGKMKKVDKTSWTNPNTGATNSCGFAALPGGYRNFLGKFFDVGNIGYWWTSTDVSYSAAWVRFISFDIIYVNKDSYDTKNAYSVRCIKDN